MLATLKRTRASSSAGSTCLSAVPANFRPSSPSPAANKEMARLATNGPRRGWRTGASSKARPASVAAVPGSVVPRASAACSKVSMAVLSPGSALSASC